MPKAGEGSGPISLSSEPVSVAVNEHVAARRLGLSVDTLRRDRRLGHLGIPFIKIGSGKHGTVRYDLVDLDRFLEARKRRTLPPAPQPLTPIEQPEPQQCSPSCRPSLQPKNRTPASRPRRADRRRRPRGKPSLRLSWPRPKRNHSRAASSLDHIARAVISAGNRDAHHWSRRRNRTPAPWSSGPRNSIPAAA